MAQEPNHGISYLMALKRNGSDAASAAAPARESSPETQPGGTGNYQSAPAQPSYHGAEKRRTRYKCEGSAQMRELTAKSTPGRALPISAFTAARLRPRPPIPWEPVLQLKLEANGVKVEVTGNVRVSYPYLGMGIAFVNMTDENEARLLDMLSTISHLAALGDHGTGHSFVTPYHWTAGGGTSDLRPHGRDPGAR
jgi:hypothetical protein